MPFRDTDLEALYYYGKFLLTRLPRADSGDAVDLDGVVVLTHLRTELIAEQQNASLSEGGDEPLVGPGEGRGKQHDQPTDTLSALIEAFNERFGLNLTDVDRILFEQQATHLQADEEVRVVALHNDLEQFRVFIAGQGRGLDSRPARAERSHLPGVLRPARVPRDAQRVACDCCLPRRASGRAGGMTLPAKPRKGRRLVQCPECEQSVPVRNGERQVYERHLAHGRLCPGTGVEMPTAQQTRKPPKAVPAAPKRGKRPDAKEAERRAREAVRKSERTERETRDAAWRAEYGSERSVRAVSGGAPTLGKGHR